MCGYPGTSSLLLLKRSLCVEVCKHVDKLTIHIQFCRLFLSFQGVVYQYTRGYRITGILRHPCPSVNSRILKHQMTSCFPFMLSRRRKRLNRDGVAPEPRTATKSTGKPIR